MKVLSLSSSFFLLFILFNLSYAATCPHSDSTLVAWSTVPRLNVANAAIVVAANERFLLDKSPSVFIQSIEVNGEVVVNNANIELNVSWIKVNDGGAWTAGAAACRITNKVILTFFGDRTEANVIPDDTFDGVAFGSKGFIVATGGTLTLFGSNSGPIWARLTRTAKVNDTVIYVDQDVRWKAGDMIVVTSTDFSEMLSGFNSSYSSLSWTRGLAMPDQSENVTIKSISGRTVTLDRPLNYTHWGVGVERAEVGLLTHNIVFRGDAKSDEQEFGGHLMMRKAKKIHIEGVEFTRFGQRGVLGRYPVHFHVQREVIGMDFTIAHSSIHNNYQRCLVIHESHGVLVEDVVGYRTLGHMFFLEDGGERMNTLNRVLGISARPVAKEEIKYGKKIQIIPTDSDVSIFWVTNMNNSITNCVAVGGKFGFWQLMPAAVTGPSNVLYPTDYNPRTVGVGAFKDNIAHSCADTGFEFDNYLTAEGTTEEGSYSPRPMPVFSGLIAYKCRQFGIWGKSSMEFFDLILMDNRRSLMVNGATIIHDSLFVGESDNIGRILPNRGHSRSFTDQNGGNTTKICGHESYDNGGPQYSYNNRFVNFTTSATRKAGALCPLQTGPFMLDTKNRVFNLTFENANRVHVGSPRTGDNEYGWTVLDNDGSVTELVGGGWIVSQNASHLLNADCIHRPDWEAWACPPFAGGYVQITITSQITATAPTIHLNGSDVSSNFNSSNRNTRAIFYEMGTTGRFGKVLGANLDCVNKTKNACFQFMHNVIPRKFYTIRFMLNDFYIQTPATVLVNMHSAFPGDYVFVAIPYPTNAAPFNISYGTNLYCSEVTNINDLNTTTYYYDSNTEHLYLRMKTTVTQSNVVNRNGNLTDYGGQGFNYLVQTSCTKCAPTESKVKTIPKPPTLSLKEQAYQADLQTCQVTTRKANYGTGSAFFWFYPDSQELHYNIYHDLPLNFPTSISLGLGKVGEKQYIISAKNFRGTTSPLRGIFTLSRAQWADLVKGNLFVQVSSRDYPDGHLRGQIFCQAATCTVPPAMPSVNPCVPTGSFANIFNGTVYNNFQEAFGNDNTTRVYSTDSICSNYSIQLNIKGGYFLFNARTPLLVGTTYKFIEFYVKALAGSGEFAIYVQLFNSSTNQRIRAETSHIDNYLVDEFYGWTRVKIPFTAFTLLPTVFNMTRVQFQLVDTSTRRDFLIDAVRVTAGGSEPTALPATTDDVVKYKSVCQNPSTGGVSTGVSTGGVSTGDIDPTATPDGSTTAGFENSASSTSLCLFLGVVAILLAFL